MSDQVSVQVGTVPDRPNSSQQKYYTTERGLLVLQLLDQTKR